MFVTLNFFFNRQHEMMRIDLPRFVEELFQAFIIFCTNAFEFGWKKKKINNLNRRIFKVECSALLWKRVFTYLNFHTRLNHQLEKFLRFASSACNFPVMFFWLQWHWWLSEFGLCSCNSRSTRSRALKTNYNFFLDDFITFVLRHQKNVIPAIDDYGTMKQIQLKMF